MRRICMLLVLALLLGCLAGCAADSPKPTPAADETATPVSENEAPAPEVCSYSIRARGGSGEPIQGAIFNFCTDESCFPVTTDEDGLAVFTGAPARYHVQLLRAPVGWQVEGEAEFTTEPCEQSFDILFAEAEK